MRKVLKRMFFEKKFGKTFRKNKDKIYNFSESFWRRVLDIFQTSLFLFLHVGFLPSRTFNYFWKRMQKESKEYDISLKKIHLKVEPTKCNYFKPIQKLINQFTYLIDYINSSKIEYNFNLHEYLFLRELVPFGELTLFPFSNSQLLQEKHKEVF